MSLSSLLTDIQVDALSADDKRGLFDAFADEFGLVRARRLTSLRQTQVAFEAQQSQRMKEAGIEKICQHLHQPHLHN